MKTFFYLVALMLIACWVIGFYVFQVGRMVHVLPVVAFMVIVVSYVQSKKTHSNSDCTSANCN